MNTPENHCVVESSPSPRLDAINESFKKDFKDMASQDPRLDKYLLENYGFSDIMDFPFSSIDESSSKIFAAGSAVMSQRESDEIINSLSKLTF